MAVTNAHVVRVAAHVAERGYEGKQIDNQHAAGGARWAMSNACSSMSSPCRRGARGGLGHAPCETSGAIVSDQDMISKIRARQSVRNEESYTGHAADGRASATREQQVFHQLPTHVNRPTP